MDAPLAEQIPTEPVQTTSPDSEPSVGQTPPVPTNLPKTGPIQLQISNDKVDGGAGNPTHLNAQLPTDGKRYGFAVAQGGTPALFPNTNTVVATSITFNNAKYVLSIAGDGVPSTARAIQAGPPFKFQTNGNPVNISNWTVIANLKS